MEKEIKLFVIIPALKSAGTINNNLSSIFLSKFP